jgi:hypothetical protein
MLMFVGGSACEQPLDVDQAIYECSSQGDCGPGYECSVHPEHGRVCLPAGTDVTSPDETARMSHASTGCDAQESRCAIMVGLGQSRQLNVKVVDKSGDPLAGVSVAFEVERDSAGGASLEEQTATTDAAGEASMNLAAGTQTGTATIRATAGDGGTARQLEWSLFVGAVNSGAFFVEPSNETELSLESVSVMVTGSNAVPGGCDALLKRAVSPGEAVAVESTQVGAEGEIPSLVLSISTLVGSHVVLTTGLTTEGVRKTVACREEVIPSDVTGADIIQMPMREQLPIFVPNGYRYQLALDLDEAYQEVYAGYFSGLKNIVHEPGKALIGCFEPDGCSDETQIGLISLATRFMPSEQKEATLTMMGGYRAELGQTFNTEADDSNVGAGTNDISEQTLDRLYDTKFYGEGTLALRSIDWMDGQPTGELAAAEVVLGFSETELENGLICGDHASCIERFAMVGDLRLGFESAKVTAGELSLGSDMELEMFDIPSYLEGIFSYMEWDFEVASFDEFHGIDGVIEGRWDCDEVVVAMDLDSAQERDQLRAMCEGIESLPAYLDEWAADQATVLEAHLISMDCQLSEPDYAESDWWQDYRPMPVYETIGIEQACTLTWLLTDTRTELSAQITGTLTATPN